MTVEQPTISEGEEKIINTNEVKKVAPVEVISVEDEQAKKEIKEQKETENNQKIEETRGKILQQFEGQETKNEFPEGHIMNPNMLDKIAQLEAINPQTLEFDQQRYDNYINGQPKMGTYTVGENQKILQEAIEEGEDLKKSYFDTGVIYGQGGWNRYVVDKRDGTVTLSRGSSNTSGSSEYKAKLAQKTKEFGLKVEGQN